MKQISCVAEPGLSPLFTLRGENRQVSLGSVLSFNTPKGFQKLKPLHSGRLGRRWSLRWSLWKKSQPNLRFKWNQSDLFVIKGKVQESTEELRCWPVVESGWPRVRSKPHLTPLRGGSSWGKQWLSCSAFPLTSLDFQMKRGPQSGAPPRSEESSEVVQHVQPNSGLSCLEILPDNRVGNQHQRTVKSSSWQIAALNRNLPSLFLMSYICQSLLSNFFEEGVAASADPGLEVLYKYKFVRIYYINIS